MREINLNRQKLGLEDLLFGVGIVTQIRAGQNVNVTKINACNLPFDETQTLFEWAQSINLEVLGSMITELQAIYDNLPTISVVEDNLTVINTLGTNITALQSLYTNIAKLQNLDTNMPKLQNIDTNMSKLQNIDTNMSKLQAIYIDLTKLESIYDNLTMLTAIYNNLTALNNINSKVIPNLTELLLVNDNAAQVAADKLTVSTDKGIVVGYKDDVSAMKVDVETIYDTFNNSTSTSASQALTSRNQAETFAQQAEASAESIDVNNLVHRIGDETVAGIKTFISNIVGSITGNADSATKLATARTINGVSFDGSANITAPTDLGITAGTTAGPIVTSSTGTNATLPTASATASGVVTTGNQTVAGIKTFTSSPIVPTPTTNTQAANKEYVDTQTTAAKAWSAITNKPETYAPSSHTHPVVQVTGLGTAATRDVGTASGNVMEVAQYGLIANGLVNIKVSGTNDDVWNTWENIISGWGSSTRTGSPNGLNGTIGKVLNIGSEDWGTQLFFDYYGNQVFFRGKESTKNTPNPWREFYHTGNTTKNPDGTIKASSPVINLYTDKYDLHNEEQFGATPVVNRKSKGVYEITLTLGLRSEGWYLDTPNDRNGNKYFNIEWTQNITPDAVDGVVDEYRDDIVVTIETFERVWNKDTGLFDNGNPIDINDLQNRFIQLRFNEIKVLQEVTNG